MHRFHGTISLCICMLMAIATPLAAKDCQTPLTGRLVKAGQGLPGFGAVQGLPPLPLAQGEYVVSIDDGPHPATTPALIEILDRYCVKASFFLVGRNAEARPELLDLIASHGHNIGSHSFRHPDLGKLDMDGILAELHRGAEAVDTALRKSRPSAGTGRLLRLPGSASFPPIPPPQLLKALNDQGFVIAGYDLSPQDWRNAPPQESFAILFRNIKDRGIIVFHDGQPNTIGLLPLVLDELTRRHAKIVELSE